MTFSDEIAPTLYQILLPRQRGTPGRGAPLRSRPGGDPLLPLRGIPRAWAARIPTPAPGYRGAPARGVDVKPSPGRASGDPSGGPKHPKNPKNGVFSPKWAKMPFFGKNALFGHFRPFFRPREKGFYINPSRRGPAVPEKGVLWGLAGRAGKRAFLALFGASGPRRGF